MLSYIFFRLGTCLLQTGFYQGSTFLLFGGQVGGRRHTDTSLISYWLLGLGVWGRAVWRSLMPDILTLCAGDSLQTPLASNILAFVLFSEKLLYFAANIVFCFFFVVVFLLLLFLLKVKFVFYLSGIPFSFWSTS